MSTCACSMVGHCPGLLALPGVMPCAQFAALSATSPVTLLAIGAIILPAMVKQGYPK